MLTLTLNPDPGLAFDPWPWTPIPDPGSDNHCVADTTTTLIEPMRITWTLS